MGKDPISDGFDSAATGEKVLSILEGVNFSEGLFDQIKDMVDAVKNDTADADTKVALKTMLDSVTGPCGIIWDQDDCKTVRDYAETLDA